jgi:hypothetical protein
VAPEEGVLRQHARADPLARSAMAVPRSQLVALDPDQSAAEASEFSESLHPLCGTATDRRVFFPDFANLLLCFFSRCGVRCFTADCVKPHSTVNTLHG